MSVVSRLLARLTGRAVTSTAESTASKEIPSPHGLPLLGTTLDLIAAGSGPKLHLYVTARHKQLGPVYKESLGPISAVFVADSAQMRRVFALEGKHPRHLLPEPWTLYNTMYSCKRGIFFMDGDEWLHYRRIMNRLMLKEGTSEELNEPYDAVVSKLIRSWRLYVDNEIVNLECEFYNLSISFVIANLIGVQYITNQGRLQEDIDTLAGLVTSIFDRTSRLNMIPAKMAATLRLPAWRKFVAAVDSALEHGRSAVQNMVPLAGRDGLLRKLMAEDIPPETVVALVIDLMLAAGDTTAYTTQWALYLLSREPDVQERLYTALMTNPDGKEAVTQVPLLKAVIRETLRLYPAAPFIARILPEEADIGGYTIPPGQLILLSLYTTGRDTQYFAEPDRFWPERWFRDPRRSGCYAGVTDLNASLPFAMGARSCVGRKIAEMQMALTIAKVIMSYRLELVAEVDMLLRLVPVPSKPIRIIIRQRV